MEEELNENDLEERLYAMIHHVDGTQADENESRDVNPRVEEAPRSTVKRYWRTSHNSAYQKVNTPNAPTKNTPANRTPANVNKNTLAPVNRSHAAAATDTKPKEEKNGAPDSPPSALAILQNTVPQNYTKTVEILEIDENPNKVLELESSDEDEVIEIALPPKPTITIESSDEDELIIQNKKPNDKAKNSSKENKSPNKRNRDGSASPVPSVVSSMSDDFIRGDCIALNISSAQPDSESFDFSLHGSDLIEGATPSKKKKKKKNKDRVTSTPISEHAVQEINTDNIFATPKSKVKNKKPKTKSYVVSEKTIPNPDVYDSDSNQSVIDITKNHDAYVVTDKSFPSADVYESDSSVPEILTEVSQQFSPQRKTNENDSSDNNASMELPTNTTPKNVTDKTLVVDLTDEYTTLDSTQIEESIVIGNISGYSEVNEYGDNLINTSSNPEEFGRFCSTKVPQILYEDLDFDNLKGKDKVCRRRRYSLTTLRAEMEKFYNESWGGENFNHQEIQKNMSRDKSLWVIDPKDRMPNPPKRRVTCNYCNRVGHRDDTCRLKPPVCHMCGHTGHYEPRCPRKICVNCGSPNFMYSTSCRNCASWRALQCAECGQPGHPASHCPDIWRRYHNTIDENMPLEQCGEKPHYQLHCSGCARRGHLAHSCRAYRALCVLPLNPSRVVRYLRLYPPNSHKRHSKSPTTHETHVNKRRNISDPDLRKHSLNETENPKNCEGDNRVRKNFQSAEAQEAKGAEAAPEFIPVGPNRDSKGQVIQDNEVSDTSEVKTSARIYVAYNVIKRFSTPAGQEWLKKNMERFNVEVQYGNASSFLTVVGTVGDQEAFHSELRLWTGKTEPAKKPQPQNEDPQTENVMPKKKNDVLRKLSSAFDSLKGDIGDPKAILKELTFLQNRQESIKSHKVISPKQLRNNRNHINDMLKRLNMVLLGQAGLAGGAERLDTLHHLQEKVINTRNQKIPDPLRSEISQHYQTIFTALPRDDYADLVKKFYSTRPCVMRNNVAVNSPGPKKKKKKLKIVQQKPVLTPNNSVEEQPVTVAEQQPKNTPRLVNNMAKKLTWIYSRLLKPGQPSENQERDMKRLKIAYKILETKNSLTEGKGETKKEKTEMMRMAWKVLRQGTAFLHGKPQKNKKKKLVRE